MNDTINSNDKLLRIIATQQKRIAQLEDSEALLRKAETKLKDEAIRHKILIEESTDGIVVITTDGKVYEANPKYADMLGYTLEEVHQLYIWDWEKKLTRKTVSEMMVTVFKDGYHYETLHTRKDGTTYVCEISTNSTIFRGQRLIFCVCRDITERKKNEQQLKESQQLLATFIDNFRGIAYQISLDNLNSFSPDFFRGAIENITGYPCNTFNKKNNWNSIIHPNDLPNLKTVRYKLLTTPGFIAEVHYRIIHRDGTYRWVSDSAQVVTMGEKQLVHGTIFDITEQKSAEEAALQLEEQMRHSQKLEAIGTLAGGVAHDFNNILGIIMGYTDLTLADLSPDSKCYSRLMHVRKASFRAREIIKQLLTFSRKVGPKKKPVNLTSIISETVSFLSSTLPSSIKLLTDFPDEKMTILADPTQMHQVIMNLCVNASQALESGNGTINISIERIQGQDSEIENNSSIKVSIHDSGPGINPDVISRIFEPYFTTRETGKGSGMGLAVVHGIIKNHGGEIGVESNSTDGTTFSFTIPEFNQSIDDTQQYMESVVSGSESILFIDDEEEIATIAKLILEKQGFRVTTVTDPIKALTIFQTRPTTFDIIITDMTMPQLNGAQVFQEVKKIRSDIPVILCTGHSSQIDEHKAIKMGIDAYIIKPLSKNELTDAIRKTLDHADQKNHVPS